MATSKLKRIFENEKYIYFLKISGRNKYYYKGTKANSQVWDLSKCSASEFWEEFDQVNNSCETAEEVKNLTSKDKKEINSNQDLEEIEEEKPSFLDRSIF